MDAQKQREIARKGGRAAHVKGTAHEFTRDEARAAGRKGGESVSANREHMSRIGRIGGKSSAGRRQGRRRSGGHPGQSESTAGGSNSPDFGGAGASSDSFETQFPGRDAESREEAVPSPS